MQGYGPRRSAILVTALCSLTAAALGGCSLGDSGDPTSIVLPPTDRLTTESDAPSTSTSPPSITATATELPDWSIGRVIALAPRADNSRFRQGATEPRGELQETAGYNFSTPDRAVNCSVGINDRSTLACRLNNDESPTARPSDAPSGCVWEPNLVTLNSAGPQRGACRNEYPVLYRSAIVDYGTTIAIGRFSCLIETTGLYCLQAGADSGFSAGDNGYRKIYASQRAPRSLIGLEEATTTNPLIPRSTQSIPDESLTTAPPS